MRYGKIEAAGQHKNLARKLQNEAKRKCPILYSFGSATDSGGGQAGTVSIGDARVLFFPVASMAGPLWVSTAEQVKEAWGNSSLTPPQNGQLVEPTDAGQLVTSLDWEKPLNLGWLLLEAKKGLIVTPSSEIKASEMWKAIEKRVVLITPKLFSHIVNSNLEVRTSVSIDPETGAAEKGALFTYEALPRATWLWSDVVEDNYPQLNGVNFPQTDKRCKVEVKKDGQGQDEKVFIENDGEPLGEKWTTPLDVVRSGLNLIEYLGVGGMETRGFSRMKRIADWKVQP